MRTVYSWRYPALGGGGILCRHAAWPKVFVTHTGLMRHRLRANVRHRHLRWHPRWSKSYLHLGRLIRWYVDGPDSTTKFHYQYYNN